MKVSLPLCVVLAWTCLTATGCTGGVKKSELEGTWQATSMKANGKSAPEEAVKNVVFRFAGDKLFVRGNDKDFDAGELENFCTIDEQKNPKEFQFSLVKSDSPVLAIYERKEDTLTICMRHQHSDKGRPTKFESTADSELILITFKRVEGEKQAAEKK